MTALSKVTTRAILSKRNIHQIHKMVTNDLHSPEIRVADIMYRTHDSQYRDGKDKEFMTLDDHIKNSRVDPIKMRNEVYRHLLSKHENSHLSPQRVSDPDYELMAEDSDHETRKMMLGSHHRPDQEDAHFFMARAAHYDGDHEGFDAIMNHPHISNLTKSRIKFARENRWK